MASLVKTFTLPQILERQPNAIAYAPTKDQSVVIVKNIGGSTVFIGFAANDVQSTDGPGTDTFQIAPSERDFFVLEAGQKLYAASAGPAGQVSVHIFLDVPTRGIALR